MKTKQKAETKLTIVICSQIFDWKSTTTSSSNFCWLADLDSDSWSLIQSLTFKTSYSCTQAALVFFLNNIFCIISYFQANQTVGDIYNWVKSQKSNLIVWCPPGLFSRLIHFYFNAFSGWGTS